MYEKKFCVRVPHYYLTNSLLQYDSFLIKTISYINDQSGKTTTKTLFKHDNC